MTAESAKLAPDLRTVRERQMRVRRREPVEPVDLVVERCLLGRIAERLNEVVDGLGAVGRSVEDGVESRRHRGRW